MPKVIITPNPQYNAIGIRLLLAAIGVGPMIQDDTTIKCQMTDAQIDRFRNGRGAAHKLEIISDPPPIPELVETGPESDDEPIETDAAVAEPPRYPAPKPILREWNPIPLNIA